MYSNESNLIQEILVNILYGCAMFVVGCLMLFFPRTIYTLFVDLALLALLLNCIFSLIRLFKNKSIMDLLGIFLSFLFLIILYNHQEIPQYVMQTLFGIYCILYGIATGVQFLINAKNKVKGKIFLLICSLFFFCLGFVLIFADRDLKILISAFGFYLVLLGYRSILEGLQGVDAKTKRQWQRKFRLTFPAILCVFFPDWTAHLILKHFQKGEGSDWMEKKGNTDHDLSLFVHVGPVGLQKVGHISFSYKGMVYSYGNYDQRSFRLFQTMGDGVLFKVPVKEYIPNAMKYEKNTIFEYGIDLDPTSKQRLEEKLKELEANCERWLCLIERKNRYDAFEDYQEDYPSRLHVRTGAKLYKFKTGKFRTYWALGANCAAFTDSILGVLGADILSMRGILSPGTYLEWLQNEFLKKNSPVVFRQFHTLYTTKKDFE